MNDDERDGRKRRENADKHKIDFTAIYEFEWDTAVYNSNDAHGEERVVATSCVGTRLHTVVYTLREGRKRIISLRIAGNRERKENADKRIGELPREMAWLRRKQEREQQARAKEAYGMSTVGIDHIAMPTADAERLMAFYKKLGFDINDEEEWRAGTANIFSIQIGDSKINVHPEGYLADYRGPTAVPGCTDICFVWDGTVEECQKMLADAGVEVIRGPGPRKGARLRGSLPAVSLYARDPDNNLLEWMIYQ